MENPQHEPQEVVDVSPREHDSLENAAIEHPKEPNKRFNNRLIIFIGLVLVILATPLVYECVAVVMHAYAYKNYVSSKDFKGFTNTYDIFLHDGNGELAKIYSCHVTANELWDLPSFKKVQYDLLDMQYTRYQGEMIIARTYALKHKVPQYKGGLLKNILPQAKTEKQKNADANRLLNVSQKYAYVENSQNSDYCTQNLYKILIPMAYIDTYGGKHDAGGAAALDLNSVSVADLQFYIHYIDKAKLGDFTPYQKTPTSMKQVSDALDAWLSHLQTDLNTLLKVRQQNGNADSLITNFTADKASLDNDVLKKAQKVGETIQPPIGELANLLQKVEAYQTE